LDFVVSFHPVLQSNEHANIYYAALLPRRGPHIASHSVCPSVCPSVPLSTERHVAPPSELQWHTYFLARAEGRIS